MFVCFLFLFFGGEGGPAGGVGLAPAPGLNGGDRVVDASTQPQCRHFKFLRETWKGRSHGDVRDSSVTEAQRAPDLSSGHSADANI